MAKNIQVVAQRILLSVLYLFSVEVQIGLMFLNLCWRFQTCEYFLMYVLLLHYTSTVKNNESACHDLKLDRPRNQKWRSLVCAIVHEFLTHKTIIL